MMLKSFEIKNFRGISKLDLDNLKQINIFTGQNSASKTSVLESLFIHAGADNVGLALTVNSMRGVNWFATDMEQSFSPLFYNGDTSKPATFMSWDKNKNWTKVEISFSNAMITAKTPQSRISTTNSSPKALKITYSNSKKQRNEVSLFQQADGQMQVEKGLHSPTKGVYISSALVGSSDLVNRFTKVDTENKTDSVLEMMRHVEPRIKGLSIGMLSNNAVLYVDLGLKRKIPLNYAGEGLQKICNIALAFVECQGGLLLIDEIENGFHYSVLPTVWSTVCKLATEYATQLFITTHSWECLVNASQSLLEHPGLSAQIFRLDREEGGIIRPVIYDQPLLEQAIESGIEIR